MDKNTKKTIIISAAVIIIFVGALYAFGGNKGSKNENVESNATSTISTTTPEKVEIYSTGLNSGSKIVANKVDKLSVVDQLADEFVAFSGVDFDSDTWVLVYEDKNGEPGNLLGSGLFFSGTTEGVTPLLRKTEAGKKYYVTFVKDNGDRVFELTVDKPDVNSPTVSFFAK